MTFPRKEVADDEEVAAVASEETGDETAGDEADAADDTGEDDADKR